MAENYSAMVRTVQDIARECIKASNPAGIVYGVVINPDPDNMKIRLGDDCGNLELHKDQIILTNAVRDHYVWLKAHDNTEDGDSDGAGYHDQVTTKQNQQHIHDFSHEHTVTVAPSAGTTTGKIPDPDISYKTDEQSEDHDHDHNYHYRGGVFKAEYGLKKDEKVIMLQVQGGQHWVVLDRVEAAKGEEGSDDTNEPDPYNPDSNGDREGYT